MSGVPVCTSVVVFGAEGATEILLGRDLFEGVGEEDSPPENGES